jgi:DMSO/TMAO reductase YedYZ molybdopterin-dependent catalytic subunit
MRSRVWIVFLVVAAVLLAACSSGGGASGAPDVTWELTISGDVGKPLTLSYADLAKSPQTTLKDVVMQKSAGEPTLTTWSGVALSELLKRAEGPTEFTGATVIAADGYGIEISKDELEGAIVALKDDQDWITKTDPDHGPIRLVCPHTPANRWVFQLKEIQINQ